MNIQDIIVEIDAEISKLRQVKALIPVQQLPIVLYTHNQT